MADDLMTNHFLRDELEAYVAGELPAARETEIEEHLAECHVCTELSRALFATDAMLGSWTARSHGDVYLRAALDAALQETEVRDEALRARVAEWRTRWGGLTEAAIRLVLDAPIAASRLVATQVATLTRPDAMLTFAEAGAAPSGPVRRRGAIRTRGPAKPAPGPPAAALVDVQQDGQALVIRLHGLAGRDRPPLVMLIRVDDPHEHREQESVRQREDLYAARFENVGAGSYLVAVEPLVSPTAP